MRRVDWLAALTAGDRVLVVVLGFGRHCVLLLLFAFVFLLTGIVDLVGWRVEGGFCFFLRRCHSQTLEGEWCLRMGQ